MASQVSRRGGHEYMRAEGRMFKRRAGKEDQAWVEVQPEAPPKEEDPVYFLAVMAKNQSPGEPDHWLIFFGPENGPGAVFQVTGDAISMYYEHEQDVDVIASEDFSWAHEIERNITIQSQIIQRLEHWVTTIPPPSAPTQAQVTENCQNWVLKVLAALVEEGLVSMTKLQDIAARKQPLYP